MKLNFNTLKASVIILILLTLIYIFVKPDKYDSYYDTMKVLEEKGFIITTEDTHKDILFGERKWLTLNQTENIAIYIYEDHLAMEADAACIDINGSPYSTPNNIKFISWSTKPHFFKGSNIIALYGGNNPEIIHCLEDIFGKQFAGR